MLSDDTYRLLDSLRAFRHVFRHAYGVPLDRRRVEIVLEDARTLKPLLASDVDAFLATVSGESAER